MTRYRHELKYLIKHYQFEELIQVLSKLMQKDQNASESGTYDIRSLYFDDYYASAYQDKINGTLARKKYRIRIYNYSDSFIRLECKQKYSSYIYKESIQISKNEFENILQNNTSFLLSRNTPLANEFFVYHRVNILRPSAVVDYRRKVFALDAGEGRITFDYNIRAGYKHIPFFSSDSNLYPILRPDDLIMEVKFTGYLPELVRRALICDGMPQIAASKFTLSIDTLKNIKE